MQTYFLLSDLLHLTLSKPPISTLPSQKNLAMMLVGLQESREVVNHGFYFSFFPSVISLCSAGTKAAGSTVLCPGQHRV